MTEITFTTSNPTCPIKNVKLTKGEEHFTFTGLPTPSVKIQAKPASSDGSYEYAVTAEAEGGATAVLESGATIKPECRSTFVDGFKKEYSFDLPETGNEDFTFPAASTDYVSAPATNCG